jgi:predicted transcriptional regulator
MNPILCQHNPKRSRFSLPNDIWKRGLKPQGFSILAYLCYLHTHCKSFIVPGADEIASQLCMSRDMAAEQIAELNRRGLLDQHMIPVFRNTSKNFFSLPNELFFLNIGHGAITVYAYLLYCEDRRTHQCHPSYRTISTAVHLAMSTVIKHIAKLVDKQFITIQNTSYIDGRGMKWNGNNQYTILPIQAAMDHCYQQKMIRLEEQQKWQQTQALLAQNTEDAPCAPL